MKTHIQGLNSVFAKRVLSPLCGMVTFLYLPQAQGISRVPSPPRGMVTLKAKLLSCFWLFSSKPTVWDGDERGRR